MESTGDNAHTTMDRGSTDTIQATINADSSNVGTTSNPITSIQPSSSLKENLEYIDTSTRANASSSKKSTAPLSAKRKEYLDRQKRDWEEFKQWRQKQQQQQQQEEQPRPHPTPQGAPIIEQQSEPISTQPEHNDGNQMLAGGGGGQLIEEEDKQQPIQDAEKEQHNEPANNDQHQLTHAISKEQQQRQRIQRLQGIIDSIRKTATGGRAADSLGSQSSALLSIGQQQRIAQVRALKNNWSRRFK